LGVLVGNFLQRDEALFGKRKTLGKETVFADPDRSLHGKIYVSRIGEFVEKLDDVPVCA
jgi:hypothetical protein